MQELVLRDYQLKLYNDLQKHLKESGRVVAAVTTGGGKTEMAAKYILDNPHMRFLVLAHGFTNLKTNFYERLQKYLPRSEILAAKGWGDLKHADHYRVVVTLPQTVYKRVGSISGFDCLIVDEAHQYYDENKTMYEAILGWHKGQQLLLSASHYRLEGPKVFFSRQASIELGHTENTDVYMVAVESEITEDDISTRNQDIKVGREGKTGGLSTFEAIKYYVESIKGPVMIGVVSIDVARDLVGYLGAGARMSTSDNDTHSHIIDAFKHKEFRVLVVVMRGVLGFDYPRLAGFIDATFSKNIMRIEQQLGRVARIASDMRMTKKYIKIAPKERLDTYVLTMSAVLTLGHDNYYQKWDGEYRSAPTLIPSDVEERIRTRRLSSELTRCPSLTVSFKELSLTFGFMRHIWEGCKTTSLGKAIDLLKGDGSHILCESPEELAEWIRYNVPEYILRGWAPTHLSSYSYASKRGWVKQVQALIGARIKALKLTKESKKVLPKPVARVEDGKTWRSVRSCEKEVGPAVYEALQKGRKHKGMTYIYIEN